MAAPSPCTRPRTRRGPLVSLAILLACALPAQGVGDVADAADAAHFLGRPLSEVLEALRQRGLNVVYSSAVVTPELRVVLEPRSLEPRAILDEILAPLGLAARDVGSGAVLVLKAAASPPGRLKGRVVSAGQGRAIVRATVTVEGLELWTTSRPDGSFELVPLRAGTYPVRVEAPGYVDWRLTDVRIAPGRTAELVATLQVEGRFVEEVVVTPSRHAIVQQEQATRRTLEHADAVLAPSLGGDVSRVVELLPGVAAADNSAAFHVRGGDTRDVAMVLDGLELYEPFHLQSFQSPFSYVDSEIVDTVDFLGGGFTAELGDRHGGFVEISTLSPAQPHRASIQLGTVNSRASFAMSGSSDSLLLSGRAWYPEAVTNTIELGERGLDPRFADAYVKYSRSLSPRAVVSAHALLAYDRIQFAEQDGHERVDSRTRSGYAWLRALWSPSASVLSETAASVGYLDHSRSGISEPQDEGLIVDDRRNVSFIGLKQDTTWTVSNAHLLKAGFELRPLEADYAYAAGPPGRVTSRTLDPSGTSLGTYAAYRAGISNRVAAELGLRFDQQNHTDEGQFSPRLNAIWRASARSELRLGLGRFFQSQRIDELRIEDGQTSFLPAELSRQVEMTFLQRLASGVSFRLDAYARRLSRVHPRSENLFNPLQLFPETEADRVLVSPERAKVAGVEALVRSDPSRAFQWWGSYVWSSARDVIEGRDTPRSWDQTHSIRLLTAYRWGRRWSASLNGSFHTGWPTTPVFGVATTLPDGEQQIEPVLGPINSERLPGYARLDCKLSRSVDAGASRLRFDLQVLNVTNRKNVCCIDEFSFEERPDGSIETKPELDHWLGITPSFSVLWEF